MSLNAYLQVTGSKQGLIKGNVVQKGREGRILVFAFEHEVKVPTDVNSGQATGKRIHGPFTIVKEIDQATTALYQALVSNEAIENFELLCYTAAAVKSAAATGAELQYYTVILSDARIISIESSMINNKIAGNSSLPIMEKVAFTYNKIEWKYPTKNLSTIDEFENNV